METCPGPGWGSFPLKQALGWWDLSLVSPQDGGGGSGSHQAPPPLPQKLPKLLILHCRHRSLSTVAEAAEAAEATTATTEANPPPPP